MPGHELYCTCDAAIFAHISPDEGGPCIGAGKYVIGPGSGQLTAVKVSCSGSARAPNNSNAATIAVNDIIKVKKSQQRPHDFRDDERSNEFWASASNGVHVMSSAETVAIMPGTCQEESGIGCRAKARCRCTPSMYTHHPAAINAPESPGKTHGLMQIDFTVFSRAAVT